MVSKDNQSAIGFDSSESGRRTASDEPDTSGTRSGSESRLERRSILKLLGVSAIPFVAGTASASDSPSETDNEYGIGAYGDGGYGGPGDDSGSSGSDDPAAETPLENKILFDGVGTTGESEYEFTVTGDVEKSSDGGASINATDTVDDGHVTGTVSGWRDAYRFSGELETLSVDGQARVYVNGDRVSSADYGGEQSHVVTIVGNGTHSEYELTAADSIELIEGDGATVVSDERATGTIERDVHRFQLIGDLVDFTFREGGTQVYLDEQRIDPAAYTSEPTLPHAIVIDGTDTSIRSRYSFTVDGDVDEAAYCGATIDDTQTIDGSSVTGAVETGDIDAYWFDGSIADFTLAGDADVDVEYDVRP